MKKNKTNKIGLMDIKKALRDSRFRKIIPVELEEQLLEYLSNPSCPCNIPFYRTILRECRGQLQKYFPDREITDEEEELRKLAENHWSVINCNASELEGRLHKLGPGRKQIALARFEDHVTVIVNELDYAF